MGRVCVGRLCYGPSLQWAEFAMGRDVQLPSRAFIGEWSCRPLIEEDRHKSTNMDVAYILVRILVDSVQKVSAVPGFGRCGAMWFKVLVTAHVCDQ